MKRRLERTIIGEFKDGLLRRYEAISDLRLEDLDLNPFLIRLFARALGLRDGRSIVKFLVQQRLERGTVTSMGDVLQKVARKFSEGTGVEGADIMKTKSGKHHYLQVKSGPNTVGKNRAQTLSK